MEKLQYVQVKLLKYILHHKREKDKDDNTVYLETGLTWDKVYELVKEECGEMVKEFPKNT